jgi:hypothetical protein
MDDMPIPSLPPLPRHSITTAPIDTLGLGDEATQSPLGEIIHAREEFGRTMVAAIRELRQVMSETFEILASPPMSLPPMRDSETMRCELEWCTDFSDFLDEFNLAKLSDVWSLYCKNEVE